MFIESIALGFIAAAAYYSQLTQTYSLNSGMQIGLFFFILLACLCLYFIYNKYNNNNNNNNNKNKLHYISTIVLAFIFQVIWTNYHAQHRLSWQLPARYHNQVVAIQGEITGVPFYDIKSQEAKFLVLAQELCLKSNACQKLASRQTIKLYGQLKLAKNQALKAGDSIQISAKIKKPSGVSNPGGYDLEKNHFFNQIKAHGSIQNQQLIAYQAGSSFKLDNLRQYISDKMLESLEYDSLSGMLIGLTIGISDKISSSQWAILRNTGTTHLIAISGLHISLIGGLIFGLMTVIWRRVPRFLLWMPAKIASAYLTLIFTWGYGFLAGMSIATERACLMMTALMLAIIFKLRMSAAFIFSASIIFILFFEPFSVLTLGFWLSYLAIGVLIFATGNRLRFTRERLSWKIMRPQLAVFMGMLPVSLYFFQSVSLIAPLVNVIAIPWVSFVVTPVCLLSALAFMCHFSWLGSALIIIAKYLYWPLWEAMQWMVGVFPVIWHFALPSGPLGIGLLLVSTLGMGILLLPKGVPYKNYIGAALAGSILLYQPLGLKKGACRFALLDVGQGLASVVFTQNHVLIYDTGPKWQENDSGSQIIKPYLDYYHIKQIDTIMISHTDLDHRGGLDSILANYPVKAIFTSEIEKLKLKTDFKASIRKISPALCQKGQSWHWDGVLFEVLHPDFDSGADAETQRNRNDLSCVLKISTGNNSILLTGDIESGAEKKLVATYGKKLKANILVAPHHGSQTSSTLEFMAQVNPDFVLFPTGKDNRFGFPRAPVIARYAQLGSHLLNTAETGAIIFDLSSEKIALPITWRKKQTRFWHEAMN